MTDRPNNKKNFHQKRDWYTIYISNDRIASIPKNLGKFLKEFDTWTDITDTGSIITFVVIAVASVFILPQVYYTPSNSIFI